VRLFTSMPVLVITCVACSSAEQSNDPLQQVASIETRELDEASGLAQSGIDGDLLWAMNDDGAPLLYGIAHDGRYRGKISINGAENRDWEDLATFSYAGHAYIVIADIGDNEARREMLTLYIVAEPRSLNAAVDVAWTIRFRYPDGPRDAESLAVDTEGEQIYVLSKRDIPAQLYALPLRPESAEPLVAERVGDLHSLPQPSAEQQANAAGSGWGWQPTAMDFAADGRYAVILTYQGVHLYTREAGQAWMVALAAKPLSLRLRNVGQAESIAIDSDRDAAFVTVEKERAPLYRIDLSRLLALQKSYN